MNRRNFCKITALAAGFLALRGHGSPLSVPAPGGAHTKGIGRCRVTVIRRNCFYDLQSRYLDDPELGPCLHFHEGQQFDISSDGGLKAPAGFCPKAWECISAHVAGVLESGTDYDCGNAPADKSVIACCNDGTRPVVFKITLLARHES